MTKALRRYFLLLATIIPGTIIIWNAVQEKLLEPIQSPAQLAQVQTVQEPTQNSQQLAQPQICDMVVHDSDGTVNMRSSPEIKSDNIITKLRNGTVLKIISTKNGWLQVDQSVPYYGHNQGWIYQDRAKKVCKPKLSQQQVQDVFKRAVDEIETERYQNAIDDLTQVIRSDPKYADAYYQRGFACYQGDLRNRQYATDLYERDLSGHGEVLSEVSKDDLAKLEVIGCENEDFDQAIRLKTSLKKAYLYKTLSGRFFLTNPDIEAFKKLVDLNPNTSEAYYYQAMAPGTSDDEAIREFTEAIRLNSHFSEAYYLRGFKRFTPWSARAGLGVPAAECSTAECYEGLKDLLQAIRLNSHFTDSFKVSWRMFVFLAYSENKQRVLKDLDHLIQKDPNNTIYFYSRGGTRLELGDYQGAIEDLTRVITANPEDSDAYYNRGLAYHRLKNYSNAVNDITQTIQLNPSSYEAHAMLSLVYYDMGNKQKAIDFSTQAIRNLSIDCSNATCEQEFNYGSDNTLMIAYLVRGATYHDLGDEANATKNFFAAKSPSWGDGGDGSIVTQDPNRLISQGRTAFGRGNYTEASLRFQQAEKIVCSKSDGQKRCQDIKKMIQGIPRKS